MGPQRERKGSFGEPRLPVARRYVEPTKRHRWLIVGAIGGAIFVAIGLYSFLTDDTALLSNGPLSSSHATMANNCSACHSPFGEVESASCSSCHEKFGDRLGVYTYAAHYLYRSGDFGRLVPSPDEQACASCHPEHGGRDADITKVIDRQCITCHTAGSFSDGHPPFDFAAEGLPDRAGLEFPHVLHVREVSTRERLADVERSCLYCHQAEADGRGFAPIDFEVSCDACHLTTATVTARLPIADPANDEIGVATLEMIRTRGEAGDRWADFLSPSEFRQTGNRVAKSPLYHEDPWILSNLRSLRRELYGDGGLADLLVASADVEPWRLPELYEEAVATLEEQARGLRGRPEPEVQDALDAIDTLIERLRRALRDPYTALDETELLLAVDQPRAELGAERVAEIEELVADLTAACRQCHEVDRATIRRVQKDQRVLRRAEFDHRAHILETRCLDCHAAIPIEETLAEGPDAEADPALDNAAIQNLPTIDTCRDCHNPRQASPSCVNCHLFHPDKGRRSELILHLDEPVAGEAAS